MWKSRKGRREEKSFSFSKSTTTVSTSVSINGREMELPEGANLNEVKAMLMQAGLDAQTIESVVASMGQAETKVQAKVECSACARTVNYGRGQCMYCGNALSLPAENDVANNSIDAEILKSDPVESEQVNAETAFINRLKDI